MTIGALLAMMAALTGLPAYHSIRRSKGRKRGRTLALVGVGLGTALFLGLGAGATAGIVEIRLRPGCVENLKKIYAGLRSYASQHGGNLPKDLQVLVEEGHLESAASLTCPAYRVQVGTVTYRLIINEPPINVRDPVFPANLMIVSDGAPFDAHEDGQVRVLLLDGTVETVPLERWDAYQRDQIDLMTEVRTRLAERRRAEDEGEEP
jgi:hypothetical protein